MTEACIIRAGDLRVAYSFEGPRDAPVVLLAHGILASRQMWDGVASALASNWRVVRYDLRGHGVTTATSPPYTISQLAADALGLLDALGIARAHFIGSSLGGMIGQVLGATAGRRLLSLTLANTTAVQGTPQAWADRIAVAQATGVRALVEPTLQRWFTPELFASDPALIDRIRHTAAQTSLEGFVGCATALQHLSQRSLLADINTPTLIIAGQADTATPISDAQLLRERIRNSQLVILPAAHQSAAECPNEFAQAWTRFQEELRPTDASDTTTGRRA